MRTAYIYLCSGGLYYSCLMRSSSAATSRVPNCRIAGNNYHSLAPSRSARTNSRHTWSCLTGSRKSGSRIGASPLLPMRTLAAGCLNGGPEECEVRAAAAGSGKRYPAEAARREDAFLLSIREPGSARKGKKKGNVWGV